MAVQIQLRNGTAAQWTSANPVLAAGEVGIESDTRKQKFGDGTTAWNSLSYAGGSGTVTGVTGTSPVASSGGTAPAISLASGYGDTLNPYASKTANQVLAAPNGASGVPSFRALVSADIPTLNQNTTGTAAGLSSTLAVASGGTGLTSTPANGALDIGNGTGFTRTTLTAGSNVTITNGAGSITIASTGGGGGTPGGANTNIQFNSSSTFGGSANLTWDGTNVQLGGAGALRFADTDNSNYASFQSPATLTANTAYTLPTALPTANGQALVATTAGAMSWTTVGGGGGSPGGSTTQIQYNNAGAFGGVSGFTTDGTRVTASTTIGVGGATPSTSGNGITFPATAVLSTDPNTLDDFEEGTWTPTDASGSGVTINTYGSTRYRKIGNIVTIVGILDIQTNASGATASIGGLPYVSGSGSLSGVTPGITTSGSTTYVNLNVPDSGGNTALRLFSITGAGLTNLQLSGVVLYVSLNYYTSSTT